PSLIGYSFEEVKLIIEEAGFVLGSVQYKVSETYLPNTVIDQFPKPNELASPGTVINVTIAK
ncbi:MAG: PASTA domain-containing protein, partial [Ignavibacteria bacterium]|nr:PASTA domain-containing protein [Ignavibacteria bacterium]